MAQLHSTSLNADKSAACKPSALVVFGDSMSDGGARGYGVGNPKHWRTGNYPPAMMEHAMQKIEQHFGSTYPFAELGFYEGCFTDGPSWPYHLGIADVHNFAHGSATTCQAPATGEKAPSGFHPLRSTTGMSQFPEMTVFPRGMAQQIQEAEEILPKEMWSDPSVLFVVIGGANDYIYHETDAIGRTAEEASESPTVKNHQQIINNLRRLGVRDGNIIVTGLVALDVMPAYCTDPNTDLVWLRSQIQAVNDCIASMGPRRWEVDRLMRELDLEEQGNDFSVYDRMYTFREPQDLVKKVLQEPKKPGFFDEYHPNLLAHQLMAEHFACQFF